MKNIALKFSVFFILVTILPCRSQAQCIKDRSQELKKIKEADQKERLHWDSMSSKERLKVDRNDELRRNRVAEIFAEGCFKTGEDYYNAALVFQHGEVPDHYYQTYLWASRAVELGNQNGLGLSALGVDRYLMHKGYKQLYGSQASTIPNDPHGCYCLWPVEKLVTDDDRRKLHTPPLADELHWIEQINTGKSCPSASMCSTEAKDVPKGSIPGVAW